ncbi:phage head morphogenesis protein [Laribacter hongkongensis]|uniref:phage head morphogenesis protein n=1 Tax=Laribacter hongkongensis TaxID=168471 RepID=UPI0003F7B398|nr:phage minor head protein [Laribacter hongkongensis]
MRTIVEEEIGGVQLLVQDKDGDPPTGLFARAFNSAMDRAIERIARLVPRSMLERMAAGMVRRANQQNHRQTAQAVNAAIGIDVGQMIERSPSVAAQVEAATIHNVNLITSIQSQYLDQVRTTVMQAVTSGQRHESIIASVRETGRVSESRARLIARDQTNKLNGALTKARQTSLGVRRYRWSGANDERERETHRENNGKIFSWDDPPPTGHPGEDINCRCVAIPIIELD